MIIPSLQIDNDSDIGVSARKKKPASPQYADGICLRSRPNRNRKTPAVIDETAWLIHPDFINFASLVL
jgi:hypothetical protein